MLARKLILLLSTLILSSSYAAQIYVDPSAASNSSSANTAASSPVQPYQYPTSTPTSSSGANQVKLPTTPPPGSISNSGTTATTAPTAAASPASPQSSQQSIAVPQAASPAVPQNTQNIPVPPKSPAISTSTAVASPSPSPSPSSFTSTLVPQSSNIGDGDAALVYGPAAKQKWMQGCIAGASSEPNVKQYAQTFCECGWNKLSSGNVPAQLWLSQNPQDIAKLNAALTTIREQCQVELQASMPNTPSVAK